MLSIYSETRSWPTNGCSSSNDCSAVQCHRVGHEARGVRTHACNPSGPAASAVWGGQESLAKKGMMQSLWTEAWNRSFCFCLKLLRIIGCSKSKLIVELISKLVFCPCFLSWHLIICRTPLGSGSLGLCVPLVLALLYTARPDLYSKTELPFGLHGACYIYTSLTILISLLWFDFWLLKFELIWKPNLNLIWICLCRAWSARQSLPPGMQMPRWSRP